MNLTRSGLVFIGAMAVAGSLGCSQKRKQVTERDRTEAAHLVSEAQFAITIKEWARAEGLLAKAVQVAPDGDYWLTLGATRVRLGNRSGAKAAYQAALKLYEDDAARDSQRSDPWLKQIYVLAVMGRLDDSRSVLTKAVKRFPNDSRLRTLTDPKQFERMTTASSFKETAL